MSKKAPKRLWWCPEYGVKERPPAKCAHHEEGGRCGWQGYIECNAVEYAPTGKGKRSSK
jgi:hypothetical protein